MATMVNMAKNKKVVKFVPAKNNTVTEVNPYKKELTKKELKKHYDVNQQRLQNWFQSIKNNINKSIENLNMNCSGPNREKEAINIKNQLSAIKIIKQVRAGKTILQGFNFNK